MLARRSLCPHCGRVSPTVQGVCADCWEPKEDSRPFWVRRGDQSWPFRLHPIALGVLVAGVPILVLGVLLWILA
jgi:hypothetical protein